MTRPRGWSRGALVAAAAWLIAACARPSPAVPSTDAAQVAADSAVHITLERGPCFGTCPVYMVALEGSGHVLFQGRRFVADTGVSTGAVPPSRVDSLVVELTARGYFDFADRYLPGEPGCEHATTDSPSVTSEVRALGRSKRIEHYHGCGDVPAALDSLEARIDEVAGVARWINR